MLVLNSFPGEGLQRSKLGLHEFVLRMDPPVLQLGRCFSRPRKALTRPSWAPTRSWKSDLSHRRPNPRQCRTSKATNTTKLGALRSRAKTVVREAQPPAS